MRFLSFFKRRITTAFLDIYIYNHIIYIYVKLQLGLVSGFGCFQIHQVFTMQIPTSTGPSEPVVKPPSPRHLPFQETQGLHKRRVGIDMYIGSHELKINVSITNQALSLFQKKLLHHFTFLQWIHFRYWIRQILKIRVTQHG